VNPVKELYVTGGSAGQRAAVSATFDNVAVNPEALAALPGLRPYRTVRLAGDVAAAGVGLRGAGAGVIPLTTLPSNATVQQAWLYWATLGVQGTFTSPTLNGIPVDGTLIGQGDDPIGGVLQTYGYRADVTSLVAGNGSYGIADLPADGPIINDTEGASLVVLYTVPGAPLRQVAVSDGLATVTYNLLGTSTPIPIPSRLPIVRAPFVGLQAIDPAGAKLLLLAGDGQPSTTLTRDFAGLDGTLLASDPFTGSDGTAWDTKTLNASSALTAGATTATAVVSTFADSVVWVAAILSTPLESPALTVSLVGPGTGSVTSNPAGITCGST
jgi:hypothetical protein